MSGPQPPPEYAETIALLLSRARQESHEEGRRQGWQEAEAYYRAHGLLQVGLAPTVSPAQVLSRRHQEEVEMPGFTGAIPAIVGGILVMLGTMLEWARADTVLGGIARNGIDTPDGQIVLGLGLIIAILGLFAAGRSKGFPILWFLLSLAVLGIVGYDGYDISERIKQLEVESEGFAVGAVGVGIWVSGLGGLFVLFSSFLTGIKKH